MCFKLKCISKPHVVAEYGMRKAETHTTSSLCSKGVQRMLRRFSNLKLSLKFSGSGKPILIPSVSILLLSVNTIKCLIHVGSTSQNNPSPDMSGIDTRLHQLLQSLTDHPNQIRGCLDLAENSPSFRQCGLE